MPTLRKLSGPACPAIVCAQSCDNIADCIELALIQVKKPGQAYAYFAHNGALIRVDKSSTAESARQEWQTALSAQSEAYMASLPKKLTPKK